LALAVPVLFCAALLVPLALWTPHLRWYDDAYAPPAKDETTAGDRARDGAIPPAAPGPRRSRGDMGQGGPGLHPLGFGAADPSARKRVLIEAKPTDGNGRSTGNLGPLYLRSLPIVDTPQGWVEDTAGARRIADRDDGAADGWCT